MRRADGVVSLRTRDFAEGFQILIDNVWRDKLAELDDD
jgi:hypothetical protein